MHKLIKRMTACGVPEMTAVCVVNDFAKRNSMGALKLYVNMLEACYA